MSAMSLTEAQLFRMMVEFFGEDRVVWNMSVRAVCGGNLSRVSSVDSELDLDDWAKQNKCLFTVIDNEGDPHLVVELAADFSSVIDIARLTHEKYLPSILQNFGIRYISISHAELEEILSPNGTLDFYHLLEDRVLGEAVRS